MGFESLNRAEFLQAVREQAIRDMEKSGVSAGVTSFTENVKKYKGKQPLYTVEELGGLVSESMLCLNSIESMKNWLATCL